MHVERRARAHRHGRSTRRAGDGRRGGASGDGRSSCGTTRWAPGAHRPGGRPPRGQLGRPVAVVSRRSTTSCAARCAAPPTSTWRGPRGVRRPPHQARRPCRGRRLQPAPGATGTRSRQPFRALPRPFPALAAGRRPAGDALEMDLVLPAAPPGLAPRRGARPPGALRARQRRADAGRHRAAWSRRRAGSERPGDTSRFACGAGSRSFDAVCLRRAGRPAASRAGSADRPGRDPGARPFQGHATPAAAGRRLCRSRSQPVAWRDRRGPARRAARSRRRRPRRTADDRARTGTARPAARPDRTARRPALPGHRPASRPLPDELLARPSTASRRYARGLIEAAAEQAAGDQGQRRVLRGIRLGGPGPPSSGCAADLPRRPLPASSTPSGATSAPPPSARRRRCSGASERMR